MILQIAFLFTEYKMRVVLKGGFGFIGHNKQVIMHKKATGIIEGRWY